VTVDDKDLKNGANLIVLDEEERILVVREKTREQKWMLPGGRVDRGEAPRHAAQSETEEETGIITDEADFRLFAILVQRPKGVVFVYETTRYTGDIVVEEDNPESAEACFMSFSEIVSRRREFLLGYFRMILLHQRYKLGEFRNCIPYEGRLSDEVILINIPNSFGMSVQDVHKYIIRA
jgi:ADP-ribose pyrophosphatase YjhB (NUDIX family)